MPGRIPLALQNVFMQSNQGTDVKKITAPKDGTGFKLFSRGTLGGGARRERRARTRPVKAPAISSLKLERSGRPTAADASIKAIRAKPTKVAVKEDSPQAFLDRALQARGYATNKYNSLEGGYYCRPTAMQQASYGVKVNQAVRSSNATLLRMLLETGLSPNPCNNFGESMVHNVCRRGDHKMLRVMLAAGSSLQIADDYGRNPLHDACWKADPCFETVQLILGADRNLINLLDCRGASPLTYVQRDNYVAWIDFLTNKLDRFWPKRDVPLEGAERPPPLTLRPPHSMPIPDPPQGLPLEVAQMVANGQMTPEDAMCMDESDSDDDSSCYSDDSDDDSDDGSDSGSEYDSDDSEGSDFDMAEMAEICLRAGGPMKVAERCFGKEGRGFTTAMPTRKNA